MAREVIQEHMHYVAVSRKEAANIIAFLTGQLADEAITGNALGAAHTFNIEEDGRVKYKLTLTLAPEKS